jgi:uncharacterized membrane protein
MDDLSALFPWLLFLHVIAAIVAFGPTFGFPIIGAMGGREREHANFATRISLTLSHRIVLPLALTMPITGFAMIFVAGIDLSARANWWLGIAIVLYVIAITIALVINIPSARRVVALTSAPPAGGGPPPELPGLVARVKQGGMVNSVLIVVIVFLMVVKPQF